MRSRIAMALPPILDSVALSSRNSAVFFDVRRNGAVCLFSDANQRDKIQNVLFSLENPEQPWQWRNKWLPAIQIGSRYELVAVGDELWIRDGNSFFAYPEKHAISMDSYYSAISDMEHYWQEWLKKGLILPPMTPFIDAAWRSSLIQACCMFVGKYPSYGSKFYRQYWHDAFPPNILSMVETLLQYRHCEEAVEIYLFYFERFVRPNGSIDYYGPSIAEYGGLLWLSAILMREIPDKAAQIAAAVKPLLHYVFDFFNPFIKTEVSLDDKFVILVGSPEADERDVRYAYFHNNYQLLRGLEMLVSPMKEHDSLCAMELKKYARFLKHYLDEAFTKTKERLNSVPYYTEQKEAICDFQQSRAVSYANYRYYPELLESGYLSDADAQSLFLMRETCNGEYFGMSRFRDVVDHWPMAAYGRALLEYGEKARFMRLLKAHLYNYLAQDTFVAYEQIYINESPRTARAPACVPAQLLLPRLLAWSWNYRKWDGTEIRWDGPDQSVFNQI